jgi:membrane-bound serine protease (ClpP class)
VLRFPPLVLLAALAAVAGTAAETAPDTSGPPRVLSLTIDGAITLGTQEYVQAGLARARDEGFQAVLFRLDTPGGDLESTRKIVRAMLESPVPVLLWVGPAGAHAGSAGVFLTLAADVAGMHPTSNIGAAHPVSGGGRDVEAEAGKDMAKKVENDTAAFARSIAAARGRNGEWAERAVRESVAITAAEAVKDGVVDLVAPALGAGSRQRPGTPGERGTRQGQAAPGTGADRTGRAGRRQDGGPPAPAAASERASEGPG